MSPSTETPGYVWIFKTAHVHTADISTQDQEAWEVVTSEVNSLKEKVRDYILGGGREGGRKEGGREECYK